MTSGPVPTMTDAEQVVARNVLDIIAARRKEDVEVEVMSFAELDSFLGEPERALVARIQKLPPGAMGFEGDFLGLEEPPANLVVVNGQTILVQTTDGETKEKTVSTKYLPDPAYQDFLKLNDAIDEQIGRRLVIASGYRSPAYQAVVFLGSAIKHHFDLSVTGRLVALPGYSQHGLASSPAIDVSTIEVDENVLVVEFANSEEYTWLMQHAGQFNYHLSYPEGNTDGVSFEPWHWQWRG